MEQAIGTIPGIVRFIIHVRLPGDLEFIITPGPAGDSHLDSGMAGSVGVFILTVDGGAPVDIAMGTVMAIAAVTDMVPGSDTEPDTGQDREVLHEMYIETGLRELEQEM